MYSIAYAVAWPIWRQHRIQFASIFAGLIALTAIARVVPAGASADAFFCAAPSAAIFIFLLAAFSYASAGGNRKGSFDIPAYLLTLPVTTRALVGWTMLYGAIAAAVAWWLVVLLVLWPRGIPVPFFWPAFVAAGFLVCFQAHAWWPFPGPIIRMVAAAVGLGTPIALCIVGLAFDVSPTILAATFVGFGALGYLAALEGVARVRRGDVTSRSWVLEAAQELAHRLYRPRRPFGSAGVAQVWIELRQHGLVLPTLVALCLVVILTAPSNPAFPWVAFSGIVLMPAYLATFLSPLLAKPETWSRSIALSSFAATRPVSSGFFVIAKLKAALLSAFIACLVMVPAAFIWVLSHPDTEVAQVLSAFSRGTHPLRLALALAAAFLAVVLMTWVQSIQTLCINMSGRPWINYALIGAGAVVAYPLYLLGFWIFDHPEYHETLLHFVPHVITGLALTKLGIAVWVFRAVIRRRLLDPAQARTLGSLWIAAVIAGVCLAVCLVPEVRERWYRLPVVAVLAVPFVRPCLAMLATDWNRHR
jgi:hypothetical protein